MSKNSQAPEQFAAYIQALKHYYNCADDTTFAHRSGCMGVGGGGFNIEEKDTKRSPKLICGLDMDKLQPNPQDKKCDDVFIILHATDSTTTQLRYCCFVELKKGNNFDKAYKQILTSIKEFRDAFQKYAHVENGEDIKLPNQKVIGLIGGGISGINSTTLNNMREEFKKKHGLVLAKISERTYTLPN